jgi:opacity protein-like surface antigen
MKRRIFAVVALAMLAIVPSAFAAGKGSSMFSIGLGQNQANTVLTNPFGNKFDEVNVGAQYQYMFSDDYAFALSGAFGFGNAKVEETGGDEDKYTLSSYRFRVGGDRVGKIGDRFLMYMGPGIEYSSAKIKNEATGSPEFESENATTIGINGRIGGIMMLSDAVGIQGEIGHTFGMASEDGPSGSGIDKVTWMTSSFAAFWGLTFAFGGN